MRTRAIAGLSALCLGLAVVPASAAAPEADLGVNKGGGVTITTEHEFVQAGLKDECMAAVIKWRQDALDGAVRWEAGGTETTVRQYLADHGISEATYLSPKWSLDLEYVSMQRAAESAVHGKIGHQRLTADPINTATRNGMGQYAAEDLAWGTTTCTETIDRWASEKDDWVNKTPNKVTGHYTSLINPSYVSYGFAGISNANIKLSSTYSTKYVWAGHGEAKASPDESASNLSGLYSIPMNVDPAQLTDVTADNSEVAVGETIDPAVTAMVFGRSAQLQGTWDTADPAIATASDQGLTGVAPGTTTASLVMSNGKKASFTLTVVGAEITSVDNPAGVTTESGTAPVLPETVTAHYTDGSTAEVPVTWEAIDKAAYSARGGGSFTVSGTVPGAADPVTVEVTVNPATVASVAPISVSTTEGVAPVLPGTAQVTWSNGDVTDEAVSWPAIEESSYAAPGSFTVMGTVAGTDVSATVTVTEAEPEITSVDDPAEITTESGTAPVLPETVTAHYSDGSTAEVPVTWAAMDAADYSYRGGGTFTVAGTVDGVTDPVTATVKVTPAKALEVLGVAPIETVEGVAPELPKTAQVTWSNGDTTTESILWSGVIESDYAEPGEFVASGTAAGLPVNQPVTVVAATIASLDSPEQVVTESGTAPVLPETVVAHWTNGAVTDEPVAWAEMDPADYSYRGGGTFTVAGTVEGAEDPVTIEVKVIPAKALEVLGVEPIETVEGVAPELPKTVQVTWSNGDTTTESILWSGLIESDYAQPGEFIASGTAVGLPVNQPVTVVAKAPQSVEAPADVTTPVGVAPSLPETVVVHWTNGETTNEPVTWDAIAAESYEKPGTFEVLGVTVDDLQVSITVNVLADEPAPTPDDPAPAPGGDKPAPDKPSADKPAADKPYGNDPKLPHTGASVVVIGLVALALIGAGVILRRRA